MLVIKFQEYVHDIYGLIKHFKYFQVDKKSHKDLMLAHRVGKKSKKRQKRLDRALELLKVGSINSRLNIFTISLVSILSYSHCHHKTELFRLGHSLSIYWQLYPVFRMIVKFGEVLQIMFLTGRFLPSIITFPLILTDIEPFQQWV